MRLAQELVCPSVVLNVDGVGSGRLCFDDRVGQ